MIFLADLNLFTLAFYAKILHHFDFLSLSYHLLSQSVWLFLMINTKCYHLQVCNTCIARCNSNYCCPIPMFTVLFCCLNLQWLYFWKMRYFLSAEVVIDFDSLLATLIMRANDRTRSENQNDAKFGHKIQECIDVK